MVEDDVKLKELESELKAAANSQTVQDIRTGWLGRKGLITAQLKGVAELPVEQRRQAGQHWNSMRVAAEALINETFERIQYQEETRQLEQERLDMTLPGVAPTVGMLHPLTRVRRMVEDVFLRMGYTLAYGPEVESEWYNFEALNIPANHPARDMQDSFFVDIPGMVLRTHTSPIQIRGMQESHGTLPVKIIAPGRVYRRDDDPTHTPMFHQIEGLLVDRNISLADLQGTLLAMTKDLLGSAIKTRFRPSYFPFTEPSMEVDVTCAACNGSGCRVCKGTGWVEILGSGMVHPIVLRNGGYDPAKVSGFAFGLGIERLAMRIFELDDLRLLYQNDLQFLSQFTRYTGRPLL